MEIDRPTLLIVVVVATLAENLPSTVVILFKRSRYCEDSRGK